jgi:hypothetical protein
MDAGNFYRQQHLCQKVTEVELCLTARLNKEMSNQSGFNSVESA